MRHIRHLGEGSTLKKDSEKNAASAALEAIHSNPEKYISVKRGKVEANMRQRMKAKIEARTV